MVVADIDTEFADGVMEGSVATDAPPKETKERPIFGKIKDLELARDGMSDYILMLEDRLSVVEERDSRLVDEMAEIRKNLFGKDWSAINRKVEQLHRLVFRRIEAGDDFRNE